MRSVCASGSAMELRFMRSKPRQALSTAAAQPASRAGSSREYCDRALAELPALKSLKQQYGTTEPLIGACIAVLCPATGPVAALLGVLARLGAQIRWAANDPVDDTVVLQAREMGWPVFVGEENSIESHLNAIHRAFECQDGGVPNLIIDTDAELARLIHLGVAAEAGAMPNPTDDEETAVCRAIRRRLAVRPSSYSTIATNVVGLSECTARGAERLRQIEKAGGLLFPAIDASSSGLPGRAPDRSRIATHTLEGLLARQALAQIELFSNRVSYPPGVHRFPTRLNQALSEFGAVAEPSEGAARASGKGASGDRSGPSADPRR